MRHLIYAFIFPLPFPTTWKQTLAWKRVCAGLAGYVVYSASVSVSEGTLEKRRRAMVPAAKIQEWL